MPLSDVPDVDIDPSGVYKYILIKVTDRSNSEEKHIVRGYASCHFHANILEETKKKTPRDLKLKCVGGGRIKHDPDIKDLFVYGYSQGFGQADHTISVAILKKAYPNYSVTYSNEGY